MPAPLPSSTLADRLAGLPGEVGLDAEEAGRLKRLLFKALDRLLAMLVGLAARYAAGTLPITPARTIRPGPAAHLRKVATSRRVGGTWRTRDYVQDHYPENIAALEKLASNQMALEAGCAPWSSRTVARRSPYASTAGPCKKTDS